MRFSTMTRGKGKLYIALDVEVPEGARLEAHSRLANNDRLPAELFRLEGGSCLLVLASLTVDQTVSVLVFGTDGSLLEAQDHKVGHAASALSSKFNTLRRNPVVDAIRNYDEVPALEHAWMRVDRIVNLENGNELVHGYVMVACSSDAAHDALELVLLDRTGAYIGLQGVTVMNDRLMHVDNACAGRVRVIEVSITKPRDIDSFIIWMCFAGGRLPSGFLGVEAHEAANYRRLFDSQVEESGQGACYDEWFRLFEKTPPLLLATQANACFEIEPRFSIIVPLYETPIAFFEEMVASVCAQTYRNFELVLVNSSPKDRKLRQALEGAALGDERVKVVTLEDNEGITLNTRAGIHAATGDFLCFLDHDDVLEPDILFEYVRAINAYPETDLLYCDEDKLVDGRYADGFLKPDFDWDTLTSVNYVAHMLAVRTSVVEELGDLGGSEYDGAQDHHLTMCVAERARNVFHVRKVLYHWRVHKRSTAAGAEAKDWTQNAGACAINEHFERMGVRAHAQPHALLPNNYDVRYELPAQPPLVSIIIPNKDHIDMLDRCLESIFAKTTYGNFEIIIVENNSEDEATFDYYDDLSNKYQNVKVVTYEGAFNFSAICNMGARLATGEMLLFLNNDMELITPDWLERMVGLCLREDIGCVGAKLLFPDDTIQHAGVVFPHGDPCHLCRLMPKDSLHWFGMLQVTRGLTAVTGACMLVKRAVFDSVSGFDEEFAVAYNDIDFCLRIRQTGKSIVIQPQAQLYHFESASRGFDFYDIEKRMRLAVEAGRLRERWPSYYGAGDPFYSPRFRDFSEYCQLEWRDYQWDLA